MLLGNWLKANYDLDDIPIEDITWLEWWNNQNDIVIQCDEIVSNIDPADMTGSSESLASFVNIHIFVRDYDVHSTEPESEPFGSELLPFNQELNASDIMGLLVPYIKQLIDDNPGALEIDGVPEMEILDDREIPAFNWNSDLFRWIITVRMIYTEN